MRNRKDVFKFDIIQKLRFTEKGMPILKGTDFVPKELISFNYALTERDKRSKGVHFFIDDYQFERIWTEPNKYLNLLRKFACVIMPDFSMYRNIPKPMQIWNSYRSKLIASYYEQSGMIVIPNLNWSDEQSLKFSLDGLPKYSVVALSTNGVLNNKTKEGFLKCFHLATEQLQPLKILIVGKIPEELKEDKRIIKFNSHSERFDNMEVKHGRKI